LVYGSPETWNAGFHGFALGSSIPAGIHGARIAYGKLSSSLSRGAFIGGSTVTGGGLFAMNGHAANWDWSKPGMYYGLLDAVTGASDLPMLAYSGNKFLRKGFTKVKAGLHNRKYGRLPSHSDHYIDFPEDGPLWKTIKRKTGFFPIADSLHLSELKYFMKAVGIVGLPIAFAGLSHDLDMGDPNSYREVFGTAMTINQIFSTGKYAYRQHKLGRVLKDNDAKRQFSKEIAESAVSQYKDELRNRLHIDRLIESELESLPGSSSADGNKILVQKTVKDVVMDYSYKLKEVAETRRDERILTERIVDDTINLYERGSIDVPGPSSANVAGSSIYNDIKVRTEQIVSHVIEFYRDKLTKLPEVGDVSNVNISNRAVSIGITDTHIVAGFSGNQDTGLIALYTHKDFKGHKLVDYFFQKDNSKIAGKGIVVADSPELNEVMARHMYENQENIKKNNLEELFEKINTESLDKMLGDELSRNGKVNEKVLAFLQENREKGEWMSPDSLRAKIVEIYLKSDSSLKDLLLKKEQKVTEASKYNEELKSIPEEEKSVTKWWDEYQNLIEQKKSLEKNNKKKIPKEEIKILEEKIQNKEHDENIHQDNRKRLELLKLNEQIIELKKKGKEKDKSKKDELEKEINELKNKAEKSMSERQKLSKEFDDLNKEVNKLEQDIAKKTKDLKKEVQEFLKESSLLEEVEKLDKKLAPWVHNNCAEAHVITALTRAKEVFPGHQVEVLIKYLATYKELNSGESLVAFDRCSHCVQSTMVIDYAIITEEEWGNWHKERKSKADNMIAIYGKVPNFSIHMTNRSVKEENSSSIRKKRSVFLELGEVETISNSKIRAGRVTSISNQLSRESVIDINKKITNSATRTSSWINDLFGWIRSSVSGLLGSELPEVVSSTKSPISQVDAKMDVNGTIMLLDLLIRKVTDQKYISTADQSISPLEAQGYALNITKRFEKVVEQAGLKSGISMHRLNIDFVEIQKEVTGKIMSGKFDEISGVLSSYLEKACPSREAGCPGKLSSKKFDKFMVEFNSRLNVVLNRSIQRILHNGDGRLEVDDAKQMNLEPQSYLSNASVQGHSKDKVSTCLSEIGVTKLGGNLNR